MKNPKHFSIITKEKVLKMEYIRTPKEIWNDLSKEFNFTTDACASHKNHLCSKYWTKEDDALKQDWNDQVIYCHPMYDRYIPKFIKKAVESNSKCVFLLPSSTNSVYFHHGQNANDFEHAYMSCVYNNTSNAATSVRFYFNAGSVSSGIYKMYGIKS